MLIILLLALVIIIIIHFIHSFIQEFIRCPFKKSTQRRPPPAQPRRYRSVLSNLQITLSLFLGKRWISKGSPFQVEGPTMENGKLSQTQTFVGCGGALVEMMTFNPRVVGSTPALAAT